jgi:hypothetical protein
LKPATCGPEPAPCVPGIRTRTHPEAGAVRLSLDQQPVIPPTGLTALIPKENGLVYNHEVTCPTDRTSAGVSSANRRDSSLQVATGIRLCVLPRFARRVPLDIRRIPGVHCTHRHVRAVGSLPMTESGGVAGAHESAFWLRHAEPIWPRDLGRHAVVARSR